ncbi:hypothetical protein R1sor_001510 [Riccia sorocarpa]|uniref:Ketoreductase domain-containing protein n=1 Tax=Riccia sorocarpa TaxID=122646 RepID=A0ABD3GWH2_9MARC
MELMHLFLDLVLPPAAIIGLFVTFPLVAFLNVMYWLLTLVRREDLRNKVVLITGASSGIGEHLAYQYAQRGARLVLSARREEKLNHVAERARSMGAVDTYVVVCDVAKEENCKRLIEQTIGHYGQLNHLVLNAGVANLFLLEDAKSTEGFPIVMDTVFWGAVYPAFYALPYLRASRGRIVVVASVASWLHYPRQTFYNAAKAALVQFFDTLRSETRGIGITIAMPGFIESEMTQGKFISETGDASLKPKARDEQVGPTPVLSTKACAEAIVSGAERKKHYIVVPVWYLSFLPYRLWMPEVMEWAWKVFVLPSRHSAPPSKKILDKDPMIKKTFYTPNMLKAE